VSALSASTPVYAAPRVDFDEDVAAAREDDPESYDGWYCVSTNPWPCPAPGCDFVALHMTAAHLIVVWPSLDDAILLAQASNASAVGRNPRIVPYERSMGPCIPWDLWDRMGAPLHGKLPRPDGWESRPRRL
jgi:hypothetical protein